MITGDDIVKAAREWKGTPFHHQAAVKGVGCDCYGLIRGVAAELGLLPDHVPVTNYPRSPDGTFERILNEVLVRIPHSQAQAGDVVSFAWARDVQHIGFMSGEGTVIHGYGAGSRGKVVETPLQGRHNARVRGIFRFPELING